jgi:hypothetical protein
MLASAHQEIPENTPAKEERLAAMGGTGASYEKRQRFIGILKLVQ